MPDRFEKAARAGDSAKGLVHYMNRLQKARRRGNARKIAKFERKVQKYNNALVGVEVAAAAPRPSRPPSVAQNPTEQFVETPELRSALDNLGKLLDGDGGAPPPPPRARKKRGSVSSRFVGVCWHARKEIWQGAVKMGSMVFYTGDHEDEETCARLYNKYCERYGMLQKMNPVDEHGALVPKGKPSSRFWGVYRHRRDKKWTVHYTDKAGDQCHVGSFDDEEVAALAYNKAVRDAGLESIRNMNRVDASGRPLPRD